VKRLEIALLKVSERHTALRSHFLTSGPHLWQRV
jgi:hypothetical protein